MQSGTVLIAPLAAAVIAAVLGVAAYAWPRQQTSQPPRPVQAVLIVLLVVFGAGSLVSFLGLPMAGVMVLFDDTGVPLDKLFLEDMLPMLLTIVWFGLALFTTMLTLGGYQRGRLIGVLLLAAALGLYLASFPTASFAFQLLFHILKGALLKTSV